MLMFRIIQEELRPSQDRTRLKLKLKTLRVHVLWKVKDHFLYVSLCSIQDSNIISFLPKVILNVFQADQLYKISKGNN